MVGILIVTHSPLANALIESCKMIMGDHIEKCSALTLTLGENLEEFENDFISNLHELDTGKGVLVLVDLFAGTPANVAMRSLRENNFECVSGVNLGMVLEVLSSRCTQKLEQLKNTAIEAAQMSIVDISGKVKGK